MFRLYFIILLFLASHRTSHAQELSDIEKLLQENEIEQSDAYYEEMIASLIRLADHPMNINSAGFDSLKMLYFLSDSQIDNILAFRKTIGPFSHLNELLLVMGIGAKDLSNIKRFIQIGSPSTIKERSYTYRQEVLARIKTTRPQQAGYKKYSREAFVYEKDYLTKKRNCFQGPPIGTLFKYQATIGTRWQGGITLENDAGETYFTRNQKTGFDFLSAHVCFTPNKIIKKLILGDYKLQWGQGLIAWNGYSSGKSSASLSNEKSGNGIAPYTSTDENRFLRGIALCLQPARMLTTDLFFSHKKTDGKLSPLDTLLRKATQTATLYETGYHRNQAECSKKRNLKELSTGISISLNNRYFRAGIHMIHYHFSPPLAIGNALYQQYNEQGIHRTLVSVDYKTGIYHFYLFGETARSDNGAWSTVNGLRYSGFPHLSACAVYRRYDKQYRSHYSSGFAEYSNTSNEEGIYIGIESTPLANLKLNAYIDHFRFFSPRYQATIPGNGQEITGETTYTRPKWECNLHFKHESKPEDYKAETTLSTPRIKQEYRLQFIYHLHDQLELRIRGYYSFYTKREKKESGYLVYLDAAYTSPQENFKAQFRVAYFNTDSYNTRIYAYENNVLYGYSFPAYYDRGFRSYLNLNWKPHHLVTLYLKTGIIYYPDKTYLSSSLTQINDNKSYDFTLQIRIHI